MSEAALILSAGDSVEETPRIPLFAIPVKKPNPAYLAPDTPRPEDYDESTPEFLSELVQYDMPSEVNPVIGLEYGERSGENAAAAQVWIIKEMVGEVAYRALVAELKKMTPKNSANALHAVAEKIATVALGN